jgi:hypothetical protein
MERIEIGESELAELFLEIGNSLDSTIEVYLIGGGAMAFQGLKESTRDIDIILDNHGSATRMSDSLRALGYMESEFIPADAGRISDAIMLERIDGVRFDLFIGRVCNGLFLSESMKDRAQPRSIFGKMELRICSMEDVFLLKSVTERSRDLDDMASIYRAGLDDNILLDECDEQNRLCPEGEERIWESFLLERIIELEENYDLSVPWKSKLEVMVNRDLETRILSPILKEGPCTVKTISERLRIDEKVIRLHLENMASDGLVSLNDDEATLIE